jgi:hypothetical protein
MIDLSKLALLKRGKALTWASSERALTHGIAHRPLCKNANSAYPGQSPSQLATK